MKAIVLPEKYARPSYVEVPQPVKSDEMETLSVKTCALNHRDLWIMKGQYAGLKYPIIPGSDACAYRGSERVVINPGMFWGVDERVQDKQFQILGLPMDGTFAERVNVPADNIYPAPEHLDDAEAAAIGLAGVTAFRALVSRCMPVQGERLLVTGIGGGVALFVLQIGLAFGLEVYVTSSRPEKLNKALAMGASGGVLYSTPEWETNLKERCSEGFDIIVDGYAGASFAKLVQLARPGGRIAVYGGTGGKMSDIVPQQIFWKQISIYGSTMGSQDDFAGFLALVNEKKLKPVIDSVYRLQNTDAAFQRMESQDQFGKIVLRVSDI
ncbi:MAG: zinc-binding dehydrogenase [Saprospiraceae bacterium]|nr:zinc-binding dehydrogenase [Saprospiraceae bacterium]